MELKKFSKVIFFRMGKISTNPKSIESRERKANQASEAKAAKEKAKEDAYWADNLGFFISFSFS